MHELYVITGQTATGKTSLALQMAVEHNGELVNFDSRQVYKRLDIVTGKDITDRQFHTLHNEDTYTIGWYSLETNRHKVPIWLYDVVDPKVYFSSYDYTKLATKVITDILDRNKVPILVGGTYYYLSHLLYGIDSAGIAPDHKLREELNKLPVHALQTKLSALNSKVYYSMNNSDRNNSRRLIRKIELSIHGGKQTEQREYSLSIGNTIGRSLITHIIGLKHTNTDTMHMKIRDRVIKRITTGAIQEADSLMKAGYSPSDPGMKTIGYPQLYAYLQGTSTLEQTINLWITREVQYAKRQMTFMSRDPHIKWR